MPFKLFLGRYRLEPIIGTFSLTILVIATTHFFIDLLLITTFQKSQSEFQRFYLFIHFICLIVCMILMIYGFSTIYKPNYHAISNFRSWTLFLNMFLFFSGSFTALGFALDWILFKEECMEKDFEASTDAELSIIQSNQLNGINSTFNNNNNNQHYHSTSQTNIEKSCKSTYEGLLSTHCILYVVMQVAMIILFFNINSFKSTRFEKEDKLHAFQRKMILAERNKKLGVNQEREEEESDEEVDGKDDEESLSKSAIKGVRFGKRKSYEQDDVDADDDLQQSPNLEYITPPTAATITSPSIDGQKSPNEENALISIHHARSTGARIPSLPNLHLPISSPFQLFRTQKGSNNPSYSSPTNSPFSITIPTPPPTLSPLQSKQQPQRDVDAIMPASATSQDSSTSKQYHHRKDWTPLTAQSVCQQQQAQQQLTFPLAHGLGKPFKFRASSLLNDHHDQQPSFQIPKIVVQEYAENGKLKTEDPIKRVMKAFTSSK